MSGRHQIVVVLFVGVALVVGALRMYEAAGRRYALDSIEARSFSCFEHRVCPSPVHDVVPSMVIGALGVVVVGIALATFLRALAPPQGEGGHLPTSSATPPTRTPALPAPPPARDHGVGDG